MRYNCVRNQIKTAAMLDTFRCSTPETELLMQQDYTFNTFSSQENTRLIPLSQGKFAIVDAIDFEWLSQWKWSAMVSGKDFRAYRRDNSAPNKPTIYMHREIIRAPKHTIVDHINGNGLDNRKENLRICEHQQNIFNSRRRSDNHSGYKGVHWREDAKSWRATIAFNGKSFYLGYFKKIEDAAKAYDVAALKYFGKFARLNFPERETDESQAN